MTGPLAPRVVVAASPQIIKRGAASAAGCVERLCIASLRGRRPFGPRVVVAPFGRRFKKKPARALHHFDRSEAEWRNLTPQ